MGRTEAQAGVVVAVFAATGCAAMRGSAPAPAEGAPKDEATIGLEAILAPWHGPYGGAPPFDVAHGAVFEPALARGAELVRGEVAAITSSQEPATFANTVVALERSGRALDRAARLFSVMCNNVNTPEIQTLALDLWPMLAAVRDEVLLNAELFARIDAVYQARADAGLNAEQMRLVQKVHELFVRSGARLDAQQKARLSAINRRLAVLFTDFSNRVQADEDTWVPLGPGDLGGLPNDVIAVYRETAASRGLQGYAVANTRSAVEPFLTFSDQAALRERVWRAFVARGDHGAEGGQAAKNDTTALIAEIVKLRAERAKLLGYPSHAHWRMSDTMARDPERAEELMLRVWRPAVARVEQEVADMQRIAAAEGVSTTIEPWDYRYYMEKVRKERYDVDQADLKRYFELNNLIAASYYMAERLYGLVFEEITGAVPTFHPDVRVYRVTRRSDGSHVGLLYRDDFARQYKQSGAWQSTYRGQEKLDGKVYPVVSNSNNFAKPAAAEPVLISLDDARTLFHEFGHALHALLNDTTYPSLGNTPPDFVELPSQVHENWALTRDILDRFARHVDTDEPMPQELVDKVRSTATFNQGFATVEYLAAALVDMMLHTDPSGDVDPAAFEREALAAIGMPKEIVMRHRLPHFAHLFASDGYSAGYYSYLWSDVMAADAWMAFEEDGGPWHTETAEAFATIIMATGDATDRAQAYRDFRGHDPQVEALLKKRGFPVAPVGPRSGAEKR